MDAMEAPQAKKICYKILIPHFFYWEVRYFMIEKIDQIQVLEETIRNICENSTIDFIIGWSKKEGENSHSEVIIKTDEELAAAQSFMMKNCGCSKEENCSGCGDVVLTLNYSRCCCYVFEK